MTNKELDAAVANIANTRKAVWSVETVEMVAAEIAVNLSIRYPNDADSEPCDFDRICAKAALFAVERSPEWFAMQAEIESLKLQLSEAVYLLKLQRERQLHPMDAQLKTQAEIRKVIESYENGKNVTKM